MEGKIHKFKGVLKMRHKICGEKVVMVNGDFYCETCKKNVKGMNLFDKEG